MEGDKDNEDLLIIGKRENPRCFKRSHLHKFPSKLNSNKNDNRDYDFVA